MQRFVPDASRSDPSAPEPGSPLEPGAVLEESSIPGDQSPSSDGPSSGNQAVAFLSGKSTPRLRNFRLALATVFAALIAAAGAAAVTSLIASTAWVIVVAIVWGIAILNVDSTTVSVMNERAGAGRFKALLPRVIIIMIAGIMCGEVVSLQMFKPEIEKQMAEERIESLQRKRAEIDSRFNDELGKTTALYDKQVGQHTDSLSRLAAQLEARDAENRAAGQAVIEATRSERVLHDSEGHAYYDDRSVRAAKTEAQRASLDGAKFADTLRPDIEQARSALHDVTEAKSRNEQRISAARLRELNELEAIPEATGLLARLQALEALTARSGTVLCSRLLWFFLMLAMESAPLWLAYCERHPAAEIKEKVYNTLSRVLRSNRWREGTAIWLEAASHNWARNIVEQIDAELRAAPNASPTALRAAPNSGDRAPIDSPYRYDAELLPAAANAAPFSEKRSHSERDNETDNRVLQMLKRSPQ